MIEQKVVAVNNWVTEKQSRNLRWLLTSLSEVKKPIWQH